MTTRQTGLREQKKQATKEALRAAALRLALSCGPENVRVDDIAEAAGVSPRTYNNYFSSREQAIVAAVTLDRENRVAAAVRDSADGLADSVIEAVVEQYTDPGDGDRNAFSLITTHPALRAAFLDTATGFEDPLAEAFAQRIGDTETPTVLVLAASVAAAIRVALRQWVQPAAGSSTGLVVPSGSLAELFRAALAPLAPALDAAEERAMTNRREKG